MVVCVYCLDGGKVVLPGVIGAGGEGVKGAATESDDEVIVDNGHGGASVRWRHDAFVELGGEVEPGLGGGIEGEPVGKGDEAEGEGKATEVVDDIVDDVAVDGTAALDGHRGAGGERRCVFQVGSSVPGDVVHPVVIALTGAAFGERASFAAAK